MVLPRPTSISNQEATREFGGGSFEDFDLVGPGLNRDGVEAGAEAAGVLMDVGDLLEHCPLSASSDAVIGRGGDAEEEEGETR